MKHSQSGPSINTEITLKK